MSALAVVDMQDPSAPKDLLKACREFGFFYVENHGVPKEVMEQMFRASKAFFSLDRADKMSLKADEKFRGYTPTKVEVLDSENQTEGDSKEAYDMFREIAADSEYADMPMQGPNQWPSEDLLPGWKATMQAYYDRMIVMGIKLSGLLATGLELDPSFFDGCFSNSLSQLRITRYSSQISDPDKGVLGTGAHSDFGLITILATDDVSGLQVKLNGQWVDVPPRPGAFICNIGSMVQRWTNDHLKSTVHRVVTTHGRERYSIPFFCKPYYDAEVACLPQFVSEDNPAKYTTVSSGDFLSGLFTKMTVDAERVRAD